MPIEPRRGCGYRKVGGLYLMGEGLSAPCDILPITLKPCPTCGFTVPFQRGFMWIHKRWLFQFATEHHDRISLAQAEPCKDPPNCVLCYPGTYDQKNWGFMWVGAGDYTPESFVRESNLFGISKRISAIPKDLVMGKTWVLLAHRKVPYEGTWKSLGDKITSEDLGILKPEPVYKPAIFYAFRPTRIEFLLWKKDADATTIKALEDQGITPIIVEETPENEVHRPGEKQP